MTGIHGDFSGKVLFSSYEAYNNTPPYESLCTLLRSALEHKHQLASLDKKLKLEVHNLVDIREALHKVVTDLTNIAHMVDDSEVKTVDGHDLAILIDELQRGANGLTARLETSPLKERCKEQEKWVKAGFDKGLLETDPEAVHFAVESKLIYTVGMFREAADILDGEEITIRNEGGIAMFKVEGKWVSYASFKDRICYSQKECRFVGWNFIHPDGFIPRDWAEYDNLYPIAKLSVQGYQKMKKHADQFWSNGQPEIDPGVEKGYILQVLTTGRDLLPRAWWSQNFMEHFPAHGGVRLITPEGLLYSFVTKMRQPDQDFLSNVEIYLGTGISNVPTPDYEEPRSSDDRLITSLPISKTRFDKVLDFANRANRGICFNFARQNCIRFVQTTLGIAGVEVNTKMSTHEVFGDIFPRLSDIPVIRDIARLCTRVFCAAAPIFDAIGGLLGQVIPRPLKEMLEGVARGIGEMFSRIEAIFWNSIYLFVLGATKSIVPESRLHAKDLPEVETFRQFMDWSDIANPDATSIYYVTRLKQWMNKQKSTLLFTKPAYGLCCLDPTKAATQVPVAV